MLCIVLKIAYSIGPFVEGDQPGLQPFQQLSVHE